MRKIILLLAALMMTASIPVDGFAATKKSSGNSHSVKGYTKKNGKYVAPHRAANPGKAKNLPKKR